MCGVVVGGGGGQMASKVNEYIDLEKVGIVPKTGRAIPLSE